MRVACVGEAMIELSLSSPPRVGVAGDTLNTAIYLKRQAPEIEVDYITRLGTDPFSAQIDAFIQDHDVGTGGIERSDTLIPGLYAITTQDGERSFTYWRGQSAARDMFQTSGMPDFSGLAGYDLVYLSGITLAILPPQVRVGLREFLSTGPQVAFDSNYRPKLWEDRPTAQTEIGKWWELATIALPSIDDEMNLYDQTASEVVARFQNLGLTGALKRGAEGPVSLGSAPIHAAYPAAEQIVDTTAAGDSFNGAYLASVLSGLSQPDALMAAHNCARRVIGCHGAIIPTDSK